MRSFVVHPLSFALLIASSLIGMVSNDNSKRRNRKPNQTGMPTQQEQA